MTGHRRPLPLLMVLLLSAGAACAIDAGAPFADPALQTRYQKLTHELRCLVCQNETIADSSAPLAADLRRELRRMLAAGQSDAEIRDFLTARYGDFVLYRPPLSQKTWLLWATPGLLLALALGFAGLTIARRARAAKRDERLLDLDEGAP
jgi:cytochrome c-type biogenesis protein CcmH